MAGWYDADNIDYSRFTDIARTTPDKWGALGKALNAIGDTTQKVQDNEDLEAIAKVQQSGQTYFDGNLNRAKNTGALDAVLKANEKEHSQNIANQVAMGGGILTPDDTPMTKDQFDDMGLASGITQSEDMAKVKTLFDDQKMSNQLSGAIELRASGASIPEIKKAYPDASKELLSQMMQWQNQDEKKLWDQEKMGLQETINIGNKDYANEQAIQRLKLQDQLNDENRNDAHAKALEIAQAKAQTKEKIDEDKSLKKLRESIMKKGNEQKATKLTQADMLYEDGKLSKEQYLVELSKLNRDPLPTKENKNLKVIQEQLRNLNELRDHYQNTGKDWIMGGSKYVGPAEGGLNEMLPTVTSNQSKFDSLMQKVLLDKTSLLSGTLSDKDMSILNAAGLTNRLGEKDFEKELDRYIQSTENELQNHVKYLGSQYDLPEQYTKSSSGNNNQTPNQPPQRKSVVKNQTAQKTVVATGTTKDGKKVIKYSDGSINYVD